MTGVRAAAAIVVAIAAALLAWAAIGRGDADRSSVMTGARAAENGTEHARRHRDAEVRQRFDQAVLMLHARKYEHAVAALHRLLELAPTMPEAHVNMGFALLGLERPRAARDFFSSAIELRATQANAYFGLALALEAEGDVPAAIGAMRSYLHLSRADDPHRTRARSALWEWEMLRPAPRSDAAAAPALATPRVQTVGNAATAPSAAPP